MGGRSPLEVDESLKARGIAHGWRVYQILTDEFGYQHGEAFGPIADALIESTQVDIEHEYRKLPPDAPIDLDATGVVHEFETILGKSDVIQEFFKTATELFKLPEFIWTSVGFPDSLQDSKRTIENRRQGAQGTSAQIAPDDQRRIQEQLEAIELAGHCANRALALMRGTPPKRDGAGKRGRPGRPKLREVIELLMARGKEKRWNKTKSLTMTAQVLGCAGALTPTLPTDCTDESMNEKTPGWSEQVRKYVKTAKRS